MQEGKLSPSGDRIQGTLKSCAVKITLYLLLLNKKVLCLVKKHYYPHPPPHPHPLVISTSFHLCSLFLFFLTCFQKCSLFFTGFLSFHSF